MKDESWKTYSPKFDYEELYPDYNSSWSGHKNFAFDLIANVKPRSIIELGTYKGTSFFSFCQAVKELNIASSLYAIDTWQGDPHSGFYKEQIYEKFIIIKEKFYSELEINIIRERFDEAVHHFKDSSIELLHIDGFHTYDAVKHDFNTWLPKLSPDAIVIFHDTAEKKDDFGVYKFWEELCERYQNYFSFSHSHGLGIIFLGNSDVYYHLLLRKTFNIELYYRLVSERDSHIGLSGLQKLKVKKFEERLLPNSDDKIKIKDLEKVVRRQKDQINRDVRLIEGIKNSMTWKIGRFILSPFILLKKIKERD